MNPSRAAYFTARYARVGSSTRERGWRRRIFFASRSARPSKGSSTRPTRPRRPIRRAIAWIVKSRRPRSSSIVVVPVVTGTTTIDDDLGRRDFTIHAMARRTGRRGLVGRVLDPFDGRADLEAKKIRLLHPRSLVDDPTRAYRAVKYAARLGFIWDEEFEKALKVARRAQAFQALSGDRMRRGIEEIFLESEWERAVRLASDLSLFGEVLPGCAALALLDEPRGLEARPKPEEIWRRLLEPLAPPERAAVASRLNFPKALRRAAGVEPR